MTLTTGTDQTIDREVLLRIFETASRIRAFDDKAQAVMGSAQSFFVHYPNGTASAAHPAWCTHCKREPTPRHCASAFRRRRARGSSIPVFSSLAICWAISISIPMATTAERWGEAVRAVCRLPRKLQAA